MRLASLAATTGLVLVLTGCGGEDEPTAVPGLSPSPTSAAPSSAAPASPAPSASASQAQSAAAGRLFGDGVEVPAGVVVFGTPYDEAVATLTASLGEPTKDTGEIEPFSAYGTCPGSTLRVLEYAGGALQLLFGDVEADSPVLHTWALANTGDTVAVPRASALVGDVTTFEFGVGTPVGDLQEQVLDGFQISEDELSLDPAFVLTDQSSGFRGFLTGTSSADTVTFVEAGAGCGE